MTYIEVQERAKVIKEVITRLLFKDKKHIVTEVTIKKEVNCYNVNIESVVRDINSSKEFPFISCRNNSYGVLSLYV